MRIAAAGRGDMQARTEVEAALPQLEVKGWHITAVTRRIWEGERDWNALAEGLDRVDALLVLRVLETLAKPAAAQDRTLEHILASLPVNIREALAKKDDAVIVQALETLSPEEQQEVMAAMRSLQALDEDTEKATERLNNN